MSQETIIPKPQGVFRNDPVSESEETESTGIGQEELFNRYIRHNMNERETRHHTIHLQGASDHHFHKGKWSWFLMAAIGLMILFQSALLVSDGLAWLDFTAYEWLLPVLLVQNFGQVVVLAVYAVRYLFSDISNASPALSNGNPGGPT